MKRIPLFVVILIASILGACTSGKTCGAEPLKHKYGWKSNPNHKAGMRQFIHHPKYADTPLPDFANISKGCPPIYDQLQEGSCVANASSRIFECAWMKQHGAFLGVSRQGLYRMLLLHDGSYPDDAGSTTASAIWVLSNQGIGLESDYPYYQQSYLDSPKPCFAESCLKHLAVQFYDVDNTDHISIRKALAAGIPVVFGGYVYQALENLTADDCFDPMPDGQPIGGHERVIVGYDSKLTHTYSNGATLTGFYDVANSWGASWGNNGHSYEPMAYIEDPQYNEDFAVIATVTQ